MWYRVGGKASDSEAAVAMFAVHYTMGSIQLSIAPHDKAESGRVPRINNTAVTATPTDAGSIAAGTVPGVQAARARVGQPQTSGTILVGAVPHGRVLRDPESHVGQRKRCRMRCVVAAVAPACVGIIIKIIVVIVSRRPGAAVVDTTVEAATT